MNFPELKVKYELAGLKLVAKYIGLFQIVVSLAILVMDNLIFCIMQLSY